LARSWILHEQHFEGLQAARRGGQADGFEDAFDLVGVDLLEASYFLVA
jgi:hypothetical protein